MNQHIDQALQKTLTPYYANVSYINIPANSPLTKGTMFNYWGALEDSKVKELKKYTNGKTFDYLIVITDQNHIQDVGVFYDKYGFYQNHDPIFNETNSVMQFESVVYLFDKNFNLLLNNFEKQDLTLKNYPLLKNQSSFNQAELDEMQTWLSGTVTNDIVTIVRQTLDIPTTHQDQQA